MDSKDEHILQIIQNMLQVRNDKEEENPEGTDGRRRTVVGRRFAVVKCKYAINFVSGRYSMGGRVTNNIFFGLLLLCVIYSSDYSE